MSIIALLWGKWSVFLIQPMVYIRINTRNVHLIDNPPLRPEISVFLQPELKASLPQILKQITVKYRAAQHHWHGTCTEVCISSSPLVILCILGTDLSTWILSCFVIIYYSAIKCTDIGNCLRVFKHVNCHWLDLYEAYFRQNLTFPVIGHWTSELIVKTVSI